MSTQLPERIRRLLIALNRDIWERESALRLSLLAALAGESIFLLGKPGVAKSMIARRMKYAFRSAKAFEYLMNRFSSPDELFGPVSISRLKDEDKYERITEDYLPAADVVFLDEIWKAGPAIQNALLTALNEKKYRNGAVEIRLPLKALLAASNELPAEGEGLEALWDRFLLRLLMEPIKERHYFEAMLLQTNGEEQDTVPEELKISAEEYAEWQKNIGNIGCGEDILAFIHALREQINAHNAALDTLAEEAQNDSPNTRPLYVSDRRWRKIMHLLRTAAYFEGQAQVQLAQALLVPHCLWDNPQQINTCRQLVQEALKPVLQRYALADFVDMQQKVEQLRAEIQQATLNTQTEVRPKLHEGRYYELKGNNIPLRFILAHEFGNLQTGTEDQIWQLQAWQSYPRQSYSHGIIYARRHPSQPDAQFIEVNRLTYQNVNILQLLTETREIQTRLQPSAAAIEGWERRCQQLFALLREAEERAQTQLKSPQRYLFLSAEDTRLLDEHLVGSIQRMRTLRLDIELLQHQYSQYR